MKIQNNQQGVITDASQNNQQGVITDQNEIESFLSKKFVVLKILLQRPVQKTLEIAISRN